MLPQIAMSVQPVPLNRIKPGPYQSRQVFSPDGVLGLAQAIQSQGLIHPPIVVAHNGHFDLVAGERRWRALCALALQGQTGGLPAAVERICQADGPDWAAKQPALAQESVEVHLTPASADPWVIAAVDNLQRQNLLPTEEGAAYALLLQQGFTMVRIARETGASLPRVKNRLALVNDLPPEVGAMVDRGEFPRSDRAIAALLTLPSDQRVKMARLYGQNPQASVDVLERACRKVVEARQSVPPPPPPKPAPPPVAAPVKVQAAPAPAKPKAPAGFCPECRDAILALSEELCESCRTGSGLTPACLTCEGFLEFARQLLIRVNAAPAASGDSCE